MLSRTLLRQIARACFSEQKVSQANPSSIADLEGKNQVEIPVHLREYNKEKYEVPLKSIKRNSGNIYLMQDMLSSKLSHSQELGL